MKYFNSNPEAIDEQASYVSGCVINYRNNFQSKAFRYHFEVTVESSDRNEHQQLNTPIPGEQDWEEIPLKIWAKPF